MRGLPEFMTEGLAIRQQVEVQDITRVKPRLETHDGSLKLQLADETVITCRHLIVTCPAPQTGRLLRKVAPKLSACTKAVTYAPCWTVMVGFPTPIDLPRTITQTPAGPISWATYEPVRPRASQTAAITLQATADFSKTQLEALPADSVNIFWQPLLTAEHPLPSPLIWRHTDGAMPRLNRLPAR